jgi:hypothetical protein
VYYLAAAGDDEAQDVARLVVRNGLARHAADVYDSIEAIAAAAAAGPLHMARQRGLNVNVHSARRERSAVLSTLALVRDGGAERRIRALVAPLERSEESLRQALLAAYDDRCAGLGARRPKVIALREAAAAELARGVVPVRDPDFVCPLETDYLAEKLGPPVLAGIRIHGSVAYEAVNFIDGRRTLQDIYQALLAEFGQVDPADLEAFFKVLEKAGLIVLRAK